MRQLCGKFPGKILHRIGVTIGSFWLTGAAINSLLLEPEKPINIEIQQDNNTLYEN